MEHTVIAAHVHPILSIFRNHGQSEKDVLSQFGVDPQAATDAEHRVPIAAAVALWEGAAQLLDDPDLGLHIAESLKRGQFGIVDIAIRASSTLGEAWDRAATLTPLVSDGVRVGFRDTSEATGMYVHELATSFDSRIVHDLPIASFYRMSCDMLGVSSFTAEVWLAYPEPDSTVEHKRVFDGATIHFSKPHDAVLFPSELLGAPLVTSDPTLAKLLDKQLTPASPEKHSRLVADVRTALGQDLAGKVPSVETAAQKLGMSVRTLSRKLEGEETSFRTIIEEVRHDLALTHLARPEGTVAETAWLLGYSEPSAFHRAFRRWTGKTPRQWKLDLV